MQVRAGLDELASNRVRTLVFVILSSFELSLLTCNCVRTLSFRTLDDDSLTFGASNGQCRLVYNMVDFYEVEMNLGHPICTNFKCFYPLPHMALFLIPGTSDKQVFSQ